MSAVEKNEVHIDLEWNDDDVVPEKVTRDLIFLFERMIEATIEKIDPSKGDKVLDIGCGRAVDDVKIAAKGGKPVGLEPSRTMLSHCKNCISENEADIALVQGIGENLPFKDNSFDWVMCKGALDHFPDPYQTIKEISRILKPNGKAVVSIANFESLGHRLGRNSHYVTKYFPWRDRTKRQAWETPPDHTFRFDYPLIVDVMNSYLKIEAASGVSLLWGAPLWDKTLAILPAKVSFGIMGILDRIARRFPSLSDVVVVTCCQKSL